MIEQFLEHPLDEVTAWGCTAHGLIRSAGPSEFLRFVDDVGYPVTGNVPGYFAYPLQVARKPGIAPVALSAEVIEQDRALGRVWQNYALLQSDYYLFGSFIGGWLYFASDGGCWLIKPTSLPNAIVGSAYSVTLSVQPFGHLDEPQADPVDVSATLASNGQGGTTGASRLVAMETISSAGNRAVLRLTPTGTAFASGFLEITLADADGVITATLQVLKTSSQTWGVWAQDYTATGAGAPGTLPYKNVRVMGSLPITGSPPYDFPPGGESRTFTAESIASGDFMGALAADRFPFGTKTWASGLTGRVLGLVFDEDDVLHEYALNTRYSLAANYPEFTGTVSGTLSRTAAAAGFVDAKWTGSVAADLARDVSQRLEVEAVLLLDGTPVVTHTAVQVAAENQHFSAVLTGDNNHVPYEYSGGWGVGLRTDGGAWGGYNLAIGTATGTVTNSVTTPSPSAETWPAELYVVAGSRSPQLVTSLPQSPAPGTNPDAALVFADVIGTYKTIKLKALAFSGCEQLVQDQPATSSKPALNYEIALIYPHASSLGRGNQAEISQPAYDPVSHELVIDTVGGVPRTFV